MLIRAFCQTYGITVAVQKDLFPFSSFSISLEITQKTHSQRDTQDNEPQSLERASSVPHHLHSPELAVILIHVKDQHSEIASPKYA